ncbi:hypothetical protein OM075_22610 [Marinilabiliaceae bacterium AAT]|uniref:Uncharacterized protein n=1 Tax=Plebeiibacterium sediminum TaxID=2992112 RepID=A0AAE3M8T8_9BACT|nr:hypothetical protein [Plebeiobacterium sediminum]
MWRTDYKSSANQDKLFATFEVLGVNGRHLSEYTLYTEAWEIGY